VALFTAVRDSLAAVSSEALAAYGAH